MKIIRKLIKAYFLEKTRIVLESFYYWNNYKYGAVYISGGNGDTNVYTIYQPDFGWESSLGRWMIQYVAAMRNYVTIPIFIEIISIFILTVAFMLLVDILDIKKSLLIYLGAILFFSQPFVTFLLHIYYCSDAYTLSLFFAVLAAWLLLKENKQSKYLFATLCMIFSLSLYQSNIVVTGVVVLTYVLKDFMNTEKNIIKSFMASVKYLITGILGIVGYMIIMRLYLNSKEIQLADYKGISSMGNINIEESVKLCLSLLKNMYFEIDNSVVGYRFWIGRKLGVFINIAIITIGIIFILYKILINYREFKVVRLLLIGMTLIIMPFMWGIIAFIAPQVSIHVLIMPQLTIIYLIFLSMIQGLFKHNNTIVRMGGRLAVLAIIFIAYNYCLSANEFQYGLKLADNKAYSLALELNSRMQKEVDWKQGMKIAIVGDFVSDDMAPEYYNIYGKNEVLFWPDYASQGCWQKYFWKEQVCIIRFAI